MTGGMGGVGGIGGMDGMDGMGVGTIGGGSGGSGGWSAGGAGMRVRPGPGSALAAREPEGLWEGLASRVRAWTARHPRIVATARVVWLGWTVVSLVLLVVSMAAVPAWREAVRPWLWGYVGLVVLFLLARTKTVSWRFVALCFSAGAVVAPLIGWFEIWFAGRVGAAVEFQDGSVLVAGPVEETLKLTPLLALLVVARRRVRGFAVVDFLLVGYAAGLGFQVFEDGVREIVTAERLPSLGDLMVQLGGTSGEPRYGSLWLPGAWHVVLEEAAHFGGHAVTTALAATGIGLGYRLVRRLGPLALVVAVGPLTMVVVDHAMYNYTVSRPFGDLPEVELPRLDPEDLPEGFDYDPPERASDHRVTVTGWVQRSWQAWGRGRFEPALLTGLLAAGIVLDVRRVRRASPDLPPLPWSGEGQPPGAGRLTGPGPAAMTGPAPGTGSPPGHVAGPAPGVGSASGHVAGPAPGVGPLPTFGAPAPWPPAPGSGPPPGHLAGPGPAGSGGFPGAAGNPPGWGPTPVRPSRVSRFLEDLFRSLGHTVADVVTELVLPLRALGRPAPRPWTYDSATGTWRDSQGRTARYDLARGAWSYTSPAEGTGEEELSVRKRWLLALTYLRTRRRLAHEREHQADRVRRPGGFLVGLGWAVTAAALTAVLGWALYVLYRDVGIDDAATVIGAGVDGEFLAAILRDLADWWDGLSLVEQTLVVVAVAGLLTFGVAPALGLTWGFGATLGWVGTATVVPEYGHGLADLVEDPGAAVDDYVDNLTPQRAAFDLLTLALEVPTRGSVPNPAAAARHHIDDLGEPIIRQIDNIPGGGLLRHEGEQLVSGATAHTVSRHVGQTDAQLSQRLASSQLDRVSSFDDLAEAEHYIDRTLEANRLDLDDWLASSPTRRLVFETDFPGEEIGGVLNRGATASVPGRSVTVVLEPKPPGSDLPYVIVTAYPTPGGVP